MANRIRIFTVDETGKPRSHVLLELVVEFKPRGGKDGTVFAPATVQVVQSNHVGYASVDMPPVHHDVIDHLWVQVLGSESFRVEATPPPAWGQLPNIAVLTVPNRVPDAAVGQYPATPGADGVDLRLSPRSFGTMPELTLGEGGCESLYHNALAERTFRFTQIVLEPGKPPFTLPTDPNADDVAPYRPPAVRYGVFLEYTASWFPLGHALGEIVYSLPLAPCESVNIAVVDWSRTETTVRTQSQSIQDVLDHHQVRDRSIEETVAATLKEWQSGWSLLGSVSAVIPITKTLDASVSLGGGYSRSKGNRDINAETTQTIADSFGYATSMSRSMFGTVVVEGSQAERDVVETRTVANHNHCHALTVQYYEVLRQFRVETRFADAHDVILIKRDLDDFTADSALCLRPFLEHRLLEPQLAQCFDALARVQFGTKPQPTPPAGSEGRIKTFTVHITTGGNGINAGEVYFRLRRRNGEILNISDNISESDTRENLNDPDRNDFEAGQTNTFVCPGQGVEVQDIHQLGIRFDEDDDQWELAGLEVDYTLIGAAGVFSLYSNDRVGHLFSGDGDWWDNPNRTDRSDAVPQGGDLKAADQACADHLLHHLNCNLPYYWRAVWMQQDPGHWAILLDQIPVTMPDGRTGKLLDFVELRPVGVIGDYVAFPIDTDRLSSEYEDDHVEERLLALPARGVFAEAKLSHCCACEERDVTKFWDWTESPCPEKAPTIADIRPGSRRSTVDTSFTDLPPSVVNVVNAPKAPDPSGLSAALNLLGQSGLFRDPPTPDLGGDDKPPSSSNGKGPPAQPDKPADAREAHDRTKVIENQKRKGHLDDADAKTLLEGIAKELSPLAETSDSGELSAAKAHRMRRARKTIPSGPGFTITTTEAGEEFITGRIVIANFDVNSSDLKPDHMFGLGLVADMMNSSAQAKAYLEGRASQTGPERWNEQLSDRRANEVFFFLTDVHGVEPDKFIDVIGLGSADPLFDRHGTEEDLNRSVRLVYTVPRAVAGPPPQTSPPATSFHAEASDTWAIRLGLTMGGGLPKVFLSLASATAELKNIKTGEKRTGIISGGGLGIGYSTPGAGPHADWVEFKTDGLYIFEAFEDTPVYFSTVSIGVALVGYQEAHLQFPLLGTENIDLGGFSMGNIGFETSANLISKWNFT